DDAASEDDHTDESGGAVRSIGGLGARGVSDTHTHRCRPRVGEVMTATLQGIELRAWQHDALRAWESAGRRAVIEAVTGTGKTTLGLAAAADVLSRGLRVLVVVPSVDLLEQWYEAFYGALPSVRVGRRGAGHHDAFPRTQVLVTIVNSAITPMFQQPTGPTL